MVEIKEEKLDQIKGGMNISPVWIGIGIAALIIFLSGVIEGITNPGKCNA